MPIEFRCTGCQNCCARRTAPPASKPNAPSAARWCTIPDPDVPPPLPGDVPPPHSAAAVGADSVLATGRRRGYHLRSCGPPGGF